MGSTASTVTSVTPTLTLPLTITDSNGVNLGTAEAFKLWACVSATDETGILIDNVLPGDQVIVYDASGIASFKEANMALIKGVVGMANAIAGDALIFATDGAAAPFVDTWNKAVSSIGDAVGDGKMNHANRDMYGRDPGTGDYAKEEGGLIVCMPESKGAVYATDDFYLTGDTKNHGRKYDYYSSKAKSMNVFYPCNVSGGLMKATAGIAGAVHILAFDSKFTDNCGSYTVGIIVLRQNRPSGKSDAQLQQALMAAAPNL